MFFISSEMLVENQLSTGQWGTSQVHKWQNSSPTGAGCWEKANSQQPWYQLWSCCLCSSIGIFQDLQNQKQDLSVYTIHVWRCRVTWMFNKFQKNNQEFETAELTEKKHKTIEGTPPTVESAVIKPESVPEKSWALMPMRGNKHNPVNPWTQTHRMPNKETTCVRICLHDTCTYVCIYIYYDAIIHIQLHIYRHLIFHRIQRWNCEMQNDHETWS